jgi:predicted RNA binding protein YcfA (HicA-like mRNA interferase family)
MQINLTHKDVSNHLKGLGWSLSRTQGGHDVWEHPKAQHKIAVPRHKGDLAPGTVRDIIKKSRVE